MYRRIEVMTVDGWRGPMGALRRMGNLAPFKLRQEVSNNMGCAGALTFGTLRSGNGRFAWTDHGWDIYGKHVFQAFQEHGPTEVRVVLLDGEILYQDEHQVICLQQ